MADTTEAKTILDYRSLGEMYQDASRKAVENNPLFSMYGTGDGERYETDEVEFVKLSNVRDPAPLNTRDQAARAITPTGKESRKLSMFNFFNVMRLNRATYRFYRHPEQWTLQGGAEMELRQQTEDYAKKHMLTKQVLLSKYFTGQTIYISRATGDILESSSGEVYSISTGIPSANLSQIAKTSFGMGSGNIIDLPWDNPAAKILDHLDLMNEAVEYQGSEPLKHVWLHRTNKIWLRNNDQILETYGMPKESNAARLDNELKGDTFEINNYMFHFYGGTYEASDGSISYFVPKTKAIVTPDNGDWLARGVGVQDVPTNVGIVKDGGEWKEVYGAFSYAYETHNPPGLELYSGDNWLIGLRNPGSLFCPTVDF